MMMWNHRFVKIGISASLALGWFAGVATVGDGGSALAAGVGTGVVTVAVEGGPMVAVEPAAVADGTEEPMAVADGAGESTVASGQAKEKRCPDQALWERRIELLESALAPASADEAVNAWAEAVKNRNGAVQYSLLSPELKQQTLKPYQAVNWVTGVSSPWVDSFQVSEGVPADDGSVVYEVTLALKTSAGDAGTGTVQVTVGQQDGNRPITGLKYVDDGGDVLNGITIVP